MIIFVRLKHLGFPAPESSLRPYVAFNAELRAGFQAFVAGLEGECRRLVRHALDVATSRYARPPDLAGLSLEDGGRAVPEEEDLQNVPPRTLAHAPAPPATQILPNR